MEQRRSSHEDQEYGRQAGLCDLQAWGVLVPPHEGQQRAGQREQGEPAPVTDRSQRHDAQVDHYDVEHHLGARGPGERLTRVRVGRPGDERGQEGAEDADQRQRHGVVPERQSRRRHADDEQEADGRIYADEAIEGKGGEYRQVEDRDAAAGQGLGIDGVLLEVVLAGPDKAEAAYDSQDYACRLIDPVVVEGQLQEEPDPDDDRKYPNAGQPVPSQDDLPVNLERVLRIGSGGLGSLARRHGR